MTEWNEEYWDIDGTSLHGLGWSVGTVGGLSLPPLRGSNTPSAKRPGQLHNADKVPDSTTLVMPMWVAGIDNQTGIQAANPKLTLNDNLKTLRRLVAPPGGGQVKITRRQLLTIGGTPTILESSAYGEYLDLSPTMTGRGRAEFSLQMLLAVPYFFGAEITTANIERNIATVISSNADDIACWFNMEIDLVGPLTNPKLTNSTPTPDVWVKYTGVIGVGDKITLNCEDFTATRESDSENLISYISHGGRQYWMGLWPESNTFTLTADSGTGHAIIRYKPPYF